MNEKVKAVLSEYHDSMRRGKPLIPGVNAGAFLAVGPDTGELLHILVRNLKAPTILELGTSLGYSGIWLADAARETGGRVISMEIDAQKAQIASSMAAKAGLAEYIDVRVGDAIELLGRLESSIDFVLLDLWKDLYVPCLDAFYSKLNDGAIIVADNMISPGGEDVAAYAEAVRSRVEITSVLLPVGSGLEVSRYHSVAHD